MPIKLIRKAVLIWSGIIIIESNITSTIHGEKGIYITYTQPQNIHTSRGMRCNTHKLLCITVTTVTHIILSTLKFTIILIERFIRSLSPAVDKLADEEGDDDSYHENSQGYPDSDWHNLIAISTVSKTLPNCSKKGNYIIILSY